MRRQIEALLQPRSQAHGDGLPLNPRGQTKLQKGDRLTLLGSLAGIQEMARRCRRGWVQENRSEEGW